MNEHSWMKGPPRNVLLATDLSPRSDRALDRAAALGEQWGAELTVVHVLEEPQPFDPDMDLPSWRRPADPVSVARRALIADVGGVAEKANLVIEQGRAAEAILRTAEAEKADLIVVGIARDEPLGRFNLGKTVDRLLRGSRVPLLVVKNRARHPYRRIVVATDFSDSSRHALEAALRLFPGQKLSLFHAYDAPMAGISPDAPRYRREYRKVAERDCQTFLNGVDKPERGWREPDLFIEQGEPASLLRGYVRDQGADLVVLGTHGRSALFEAFLGSVAKRIMDNLPCDALVVREPRATVEA